ncbi:GNAT family N-acetyltransferase [Novosphingobium mangrovi (ex Huang et al. 2023)]|uniref:GNAT family N-acetyltransferase n=1 Tax=Novosphingobium mangrovi (ex Huang et al. 2023) TaxID=2976432 RepID=A0ABT2I944_9SPHN|nr:GNAT family N-acetyltransferase [Novosphingobium mangrovi (ex Huang et al. 2023)]MCT2401318.1 GNAT family N-acetyltransferase [Novosphingobium mangrovi (ex Huang et al. 2023)]
MGELKKPFRLETERLVLRDWAPGDIDRFVEGTNTPAVMRWLGGLLDTAKIDMLESRLMAFQVEYGHTFWIVERKQDGEILGFCGLKRVDAPNSTIAGEFEIGWRLREDAWGKGYAKEAATASLTAGFERFGARTIYAITVIGNTASWGLMKRLGMARREDLDYPDSRFELPLRDTIVYSIERDIWLRRCSPDRA